MQIAITGLVSSRITDGLSNVDPAALDVLDPVAPEYRTILLEGYTLESQARVFWGTGQRQTMSVQHYNHLRVRLLDDLSATLDANMFLHRDSDIDSPAVKFELQVGLGYDWRYYR